MPDRSRHPTASDGWPRHEVLPARDYPFAVAPRHGDACQPAGEFLPARRLVLSDADAGDLCDEYDLLDRRQADALWRALVLGALGFVTLVALCGVIAWLVSAAVKPHAPAPMAQLAVASEVGR